MTTINVTDARTPAPPTEEAPFTERWPIGGVVSYAKGDRARGTRVTGVIVGYGESNAGLELLSGSEQVTLSERQVASATLLAKSVRDYTRRVVFKARALARIHGWCSAPETGVSEVNRTSGVAPPEQGNVKVRVTTVGYFTMTPGRRNRALDLRDGDEVLRVLQTSYHPGYGGEWQSYDWRYVTGGGNQTDPVAEVQFELVDEFTSDNP